MKTLNQISPLIIVIMLLSIVSYGQEYDDMYFTPKDRKQVKYVQDDKVVKQDLNQVEQAAQNPGENFSQRNVNPEYIAKYQAASREEYNSDSEFASDEYYVENYDANNAQLSDVSNSFINGAVPVRDRFGNTSYVNNYNDAFWSDPFLYQGSMYDPLLWPYYGSERARFNMTYGIGFGTNRWNRWTNGWYANVGLNWGWNNFGWNNWGWNSWGWNSWGYCPPLYGSYYGYGWGHPIGNTVVINNYETRNNRTYRSGPASSRRSGVAVNNNSRRTPSTIDNSGRSGRTEYNSRSSNRNFDDAQSRYYRRSRTAVTSGQPSNGRTGSPSGRSTYGTSSRGSYSAPSRGSSRNSGFSNSGRTTRGNSNFSRPSRSSGSYSSPSRSSGNRSFNMPSRSSRSSGFNRSSGSSSRSSGVSRSRSSSSRSSAPSRSGGSSRSRRGGN